MNHKPLVLSLLLIPLVSTAEIYKWTDKTGRIHYGDSPRKEQRAERVIVEVNSYKNVSFENIEFYKRSEAGEASRVNMFSTSWCGYCKKARKYFQRNDISYVEYDIEKDAAAKKDYDRLGGRGVPVILVGKKRMNGFSQAGFERIYQ